MIERCQNPHPKLSGRMCNTLQRIRVPDDFGEGVISVECRRCGGWIDFHILAAEGTEALTGSTA